MTGQGKWRGKIQKALVTLVAMHITRDRNYEIMGNENETEVQYCSLVQPAYSKWTMSQQKVSGTINLSACYKH